MISPELLLRDGGENTTQKDDGSNSMSSINCDGGGELHRHLIHIRQLPMSLILTNALGMQCEKIPTSGKIE